MPTTRSKLFAVAVATGLLVPSVASSSDPDIACEEAYPEDCLTIWQAHALGYVEITSSAYSGVQVTIDNSGEFDLCLEDQVLYTSDGSQSFFLDDDVTDASWEIGAGDELDAYYGSWTTPNGYYYPYYGQEAWWCVEYGQYAAAGATFDYFGEQIPDALAYYIATATDTDGDGRTDKNDWAGSFGVQANYNIWSYQNTYGILTAGKLAERYDCAVLVTLTSRNIGYDTTSGTLTDTIPAGWTASEFSTAPDTETLNADGTTTVTWDLTVTGTYGGIVLDIEQITYVLDRDIVADLSYLELPGAEVYYDGGDGFQTNYSLPAAAYNLDIDCDGDVSCTEEEVCDGVDNDLDGEIDEGFDADGDGFADCMEECVVEERFCSLEDGLNLLEDGSPAVLTYDGNARWTASISGAEWIWDEYYESNPGGDEVRSIFRDFTLQSGAYDVDATLEIGADNSYEVWLNASSVASDSTEYNYFAPTDIWDLTTALASGDNALEFEVWNWAQPGGTAYSNPGGLLYCVDVAYSYEMDAEVCNGVDDDCDGLVDDDDPDVTGLGTWYADADGDGFGDPTTAVISCAAPDGYVADDTDCDDADAAINPGASELCNGVDDDCDGLVDDDDDDTVGQSTWYLDADGDSYGDPADSVASCETPTGYVTDSTDCDDGAAAINPGAAERCDGLDNDCDGSTDEGFDSDSDGIADCFDTEECDGLDNDGDGEVDEGFDVDGDGYASCGGDCDDGDAAINPGATEDCDGIDNDCDGSTDEGFDSDGDGTADCFDAEECDGVDNDGDGYVDEGGLCLDDCPELEPEECLTVWQAHARGFLDITSSSSAVVTMTNTGPYDICIDEQVLYTSDDSQTFFVDEEVSLAATELAPGDTLPVYYGSWTTDNGYYSPYLGDDAWWCVENGQYAAGGASFDWYGEEIPGSLGYFVANLTDEDGDGVDDDVDWAGSYGVQANYNIWSWQSDHAVLTAGKTASVSGGEVWVTLVSRNIGYDDGSGTLTDTIPAGWTVSSWTVEPDAQVEESDGSLTVSWDIEVQGTAGGLVLDLADLSYAMERDCGSDLPYLELDAASVAYFDGDSDVLSFSLPAAAYDIDGDGDGVVDCADEEICDGVDNDLDCEVDEGFDTDDDGWTSCDGDCNDDDAAVNPDATELCNGTDDDCDGLVDDDDDGVADQGIWYADADADGYGDAADAVISCGQPDGYVPDDSDCDDADAAVNPGAAEACNGIDDDCDSGVDEGFDADADGLADCFDSEECDGLDNDGDGEVDEGFDADADGLADCFDSEECDGIDNDGDGLVDDDDPDVSGQSTWYADADGDGYGDAASVVEACFEPSGHSDDASDCDDADAAVNPGAVEVCNELDDDCDGDIDEDLDCGEDDCPELEPAECLTLWQAHARGWLWVETGDDASVKITNVGVYDVCIDEHGLHTSESTPSMFVGPDLVGTIELAPAETRTLYYGSWTTDNDTYLPYLGEDPWWCLINHTPTRPGLVYEWYGEEVPQVLSSHIATGWDVDGDGVDDLDDWAAAWGVQAQYSVWDYQAANPVLTAGKLAEVDGGEILVSVTARNVGYLAGTGELTDTIPAGWTATFDVAPDSEVVNGDGSISVSWLVDVAGTGGAAVIDADTFGYRLARACGSDAPYAELPEAYVVYDDSVGEQTSWSMPAAAYNLDVDGDGVVDCAAEETCDGLDNDLDCEVDEGFDADGDGWISCDGDCDDDDAAVNPDATELCNGLDDDCDGLTDDDDDSVADQGTWYADADADGYGDATDVLVSCEQPDGYGPDDSDCDDADGAVNPGATEACNGLDDDCDGEVDEGFDSDADGLADCFDSEECDGLDNDGDAEIDEGFDSDADGLADCFDTEECDGVDNDGDGLVDDDDPDVAGLSTWYADADGDGYGDAGSAVAACFEPSGYTSDDTDCDDSDVDVFPGALELCNDLDDNCDGEVDEGLDCGEDDCPEVEPAECLTLWQAHARGWFDVESGSGGTVSFTNRGVYDICIDELGLYTASGTQSMFVEGELIGTIELAPGESLTLQYGSWTTDNGYYSPYLGSPAWWCIESGFSTTSGQDFDWYGEAVPEVLAVYTEPGWDSDGDGVDDLEDWAGSYGVQAQYNIWAYQAGNAVLTAGKVAEVVGPEVWVTLTSRNIGYDDGAGTLTDVIPAGWSVLAWDVAPDSETDNGDGSSTVTWAVDVAGTSGGTTVDADSFSYILVRDADSDAPYLELEPAWVVYTDSEGTQYSDSLPAAAYNVDVNGDGEQDCWEEEVCDGIDNDLDGAIDEDFDLDGDGWISCDGDCDDDDAAVNPDATELCNGLDDDCDGLTDDADDSVADQATWYADSDGDGYGDAATTTASCVQPDGFIDDHSDCDDADAAVSPAGLELCNGLDDDCDGLTDDADDSVADQATWYADADGDGYGDPLSTTLACEQPSGWTDDASDCDDADAEVNPAGVELCNGHDDDCDGLVDDEDSPVGGTTIWYADSDGDGFGDPRVTTAACEQPEGFTDDGSDCDDDDDAVNPAGVELCNGHDDDCDGLVDDEDSPVGGTAIWYADGDGDGYGDPRVTTAACEQPDGFTDDGSDCDDADASVNPAGAELCNGIDDDCDGLVDDEDSAVSGTSTWYGDSDGDGYGDPRVSTQACEQPSGWTDDGSDCDDDDAGANPGALELCNGADDDCDGSVDEGDVCGDDDCEEVAPEACLTLWQAHARGWLSIATGGSGEAVSFVNSGGYDVCLDEQALYASSDTQAFFLDAAVTDLPEQLATGDRYTAYYGSWTTDNAVYSPYLDEGAWWCVDNGNPATAGGSFVYYGEAVPEVLATWVDTLTDVDGDGVDDLVDWAGSYGVQAQYNIWDWQLDQPVLTAGKLAEEVMGEVVVTLTSRNLGDHSGEGWLVDEVPAGWSVVATERTPDQIVPNADGTTTLAWFVELEVFGYTGDTIQLAYTIARDVSADVAYLELEPAWITYASECASASGSCVILWPPDCGGEVSSSLPAAVYNIDVDQDGVQACPEEEICDGLDNDLDGVVDDGLPDADADGVCDDLDVEECDGVDNDGDAEVDEDCPGTLSGVVFFDDDQDGSQGYCEPGLVDVVVWADGPDCDGDGIEDSYQTTTDREGSYLFTDLCAGDWVVSFEEQAFDQPTTDNPVDLALGWAEDATVDFGTTRTFYVASTCWWLGNPAAVENALPFEVAGTSYETYDDVRAVLRSSRRGWAAALEQLLVLAKLNDARFGIGAHPWVDLDGDGDCETIGELMELAEAALATGDYTAFRGWCSALHRIL